MGVARAANSGISEFVDPMGRPYLASKLDEMTYVTGVLRTTDVIPLYVRLGDWGWTLVVVRTLGGGGLLLKRRFRPGRATASTSAARSPISSQSDPAGRSR